MKFIKNHKLVSNVLWFCILCDSTRPEFYQKCVKIVRKTIFQWLPVAVVTVEAELSCVEASVGFRPLTVINKDRHVLDGGS